MNDQKLLPVVLACCTCLLIGFATGYFAKATPEPKVEVRALLHAPFVEVTVNGKAVDLGKIRLVPEQPDKKKKSGDVGESGEVLRSAAYNPPIEHAIFVQRDGRNSGTEWLGLDRIVDRLIAWLADKGRETEAALARREETLAAGWSNFKAAAVVVVLTVLCPLGWMAFSLQRMADKVVHS